MPKIVTPGKLLVVCLTLAVLAIAGVWIIGGVLSQPARADAGSPPNDLVGCRRVEFASGSGATLRGWYAPGEHGAGAVTLMHGVRASRGSMLERARFLRRAGFSVLVFDFQAHGESGGERVTFGYLESRDARASVEFMREAAPGERVGIVGVSMGGAATLLAEPKLEIDALVLEMVYPTIDEAITNRLTMRLGGWASVLTPLLTLQFKPRIGVGVEAMRPVEAVARVTAPKLFIAGEEDQHTTLAESMRLFERAAEPKDIWIIPEAGHVDLHLAAREEYERRVAAFFREHLKQ